MKDLHWGGGMLDVFVEVLGRFLEGKQCKHLITTLKRYKNKKNSIIFEGELWISDSRPQNPTPGMMYCMEAECDVNKSGILRSNFNTRELNSRELFWFFGHRKKSLGAFFWKIGGNSSYRPPGPF